MEKEIQNFIASAEKERDYLGKEIIDYTSVEVIGCAVGLVLFLVLLFLGSSITGGLITGLLASMSFGIFLLKVRSNAPKLYALAINYPLTADIALTLLFFSIFGSTTALGLVAASTFGLLNTLTLTVASKVDRQENPLKNVFCFNTYNWAGQAFKVRPPL